MEDPMQRSLWSTKMRGKLSRRTKERLSAARKSKAWIKYLLLLRPPILTITSAGAQEMLWTRSPIMHSTIWSKTYTMRHYSKKKSSRRSNKCLSMPSKWAFKKRYTTSRGLSRGPWLVRATLRSRKWTVNSNKSSRWWRKVYLSYRHRFKRRHVRPRRSFTKRGVLPSSMTPSISMKSGHHLHLP